MGTYELPNITCAHMHISPVPAPRCTPRCPPFVTDRAAIKIDLQEKSLIWHTISEVQVHGFLLPSCVESVMTLGSWQQFMVEGTVLLMTTGKQRARKGWGSDGPPMT